MTAKYHHTQQLRLKHLKNGELFKFVNDVRVPGHTNFHGEYVQGALIFASNVAYKKVSARRIQPVECWISGDVNICHKTIGQPVTLKAGQSQLAVHTNVTSF
jgi:hypothetical protein